MIPRTPIARKPRTPVKKVNAKRKAREFKRCYGSKARVEFVKSLPCAACCVVGFSDNAHLLGNGGMGRKADYTTIGPLCGFRATGPISELAGCHDFYDNWPRSMFTSRFPDFDPERVARETEELWASSVLEDTK